MKRVILFVLCPTVCLFILLPLFAGPRDDQWKQVDEAVKKGLPKTAIGHLEPIIEAALKDKAYAEAIRAIGRKIALEGNVQGNKPEEKITRMKAEIAKAPAEMKPAMQAILANWYWHYFQRNRWRFMQRTATATAPGEDFTTWDLSRLFAEIDKHFTAALAAKASLQKTPVAEYSELLSKGTAPDKYRPTMYDFLANDALRFYSTGEQAAAKPQDSFILSAGSPIFADTDDFLAWKVESTDTESPVLKAVLLYQDLIRFHQQDDDPSALADADLHRLTFGNNKASGEEKTARFKAALRRFETRWVKHEISSRALHQLATAVHGEGDRVEAHKIATQGKNRFPDSHGGKLCHNLIEEIESPSANLRTERVWNDPLPTIDLTYRNLTKVWFRVVDYDWQAKLANGRRPEYLDHNQRKALLQRKPVREWSVDLPKTADYLDRVEQIDAPEDLPFGSYFLIASYNAKFTDKNNQVQFTDFWKSDLALVIRTRYGAGSLEGFVLNAITGEPIKGVRVQAWNGQYNRSWTAAGETRTDANGLFQFDGANRKHYVVVASHKNDKLGTGNNYYLYNQPNQSRPYQRTVFFTDRSLYRPGQTIHFKGICVDVDQNGDNYKTLDGRDVNLVFSDRNGKEIARQKQRTNDYGSFSGSFTAPRDRLMGRMSIRVDGQPQGATWVTVEEYKRPKFQVTIDAPQESARLNAEVVMQAKATAYTGAAINGAKVRYRVVRQVRYPAWWGWCFWWRAPQSQSQEIAHGAAQTAANGSFEIRFTAKPDPAVLEKDEPTFQYSVYADVTDTNGETRSGDRTVSVGYTALSASMSVDEWQTVDKPVELTVRTTTLNGDNEAAEGVVKVFALKQPDKVARQSMSGISPYRYGRHLVQAPKPDPGNVNSWELGELISEQPFSTDATGTTKLSFKLKAGPFRAMLETQDRFGKPVTAQLPITVLDPAAKHLAIKIVDHFAAPAWTVEPGQQFTALWGSGYESARAFIEIEHRHKVVTSFWTAKDATQTSIEHPVTESLRGGFTVRVTMVRENRARLHSHRVNVPWTNKNLTVKWERFVSKLKPAAEETWTAVISGPDAKKAAAEMVAGLYDASLDAYLPHQWQTHFNVFRSDNSNLVSQFENQQKHFQHIHGNWPRNYQSTNWNYRQFPGDVIGNLWGYGFFGGRESLRRGAVPMAANSAPLMQGQAADAEMADRASDKAAPANKRKLAKRQQAGRAGAPKSPDLDKVTARKNLNETAFFFPSLTASDDGVVRMEFTMPEALTEWKFMGFAHDRSLRAGFLQDKVVTSKDLMVQPNPPRFVREGDVLEFTVKVSNLSASRQTGKVRLSFADARTGNEADSALGNKNKDLEFDVPSQESKSFAWRIKVPDDMGFLTYKAVGSTGRLSDGEENFLPVLSRRILVTESLPLPIRGAQTKEFDFAKLKASGNSGSLKHKTLTVQMVSNPSWYAVMALPYLMEYPHQCAEQTFNRLYANALARHIAKSDPKIRRIFDLWKNTPSDTLDSPMEKNQDLKAVMLEETPWYRDAKNESEARRSVGILFDDNRLDSETASLLRRLAELQRADGAWPWFPGGPSNDYITLYITTGFGRMRHLGVDLDVTSAIKSLNRLDGWIDKQYRDILRSGNKDEYHLSTTVALYLYGRSFFLKDQPVNAKHREAVDYFIGQAKKYWLRLAVRQSQAHLAVALKRFGDQETPGDIMRSIKERSVSDEELGMFWRELELSWWWFRAPIETQAMMIEAFDEVMNDAEAVADCKVWLLKQKQTQDWKTTKATADAVYALLLRGDNLLASDALVEVSLGGTKIEPEQVEAGTGFYEHRFFGGEIRPQLGEVTVVKQDAGVAWGSLHWQYIEDMSKITPYEGTPLQVAKAVYTRTYTKKGPVLTRVNGPLNVGDELVVRVGIRTDRDMEYIHLKDQRGSGTEPVNVLSRYKYQDGLAYYESTRDTASHFFIDYLPKGTYVFEYSTRVVHKGQYQTGMAQVQCMYAPEFNSHSKSLKLTVQ